MQLIEPPVPSVCHKSHVTDQPFLKNKIMSKGIFFKHKRVFKIVHPDPKKRKGPFKSEDLKTQMANGYIPVDTPNNMVKTLLKIHNYNDENYIRPENPEAWT